MKFQLPEKAINWKITFDFLYVLLCSHITCTVFEIVNWGHQANEKALFDYLHMFHINFVKEGNIYELEPIEILMTLIYPFQGIPNSKISR